MNLKKLFSFFAKPGGREPDVESIKAVVFDAAKTNDVAALSRVLADHGVSVLRRVEGPDQLTVLHLAAASGSGDVVDLLLSEDVKADPNVVRGNNFTPLHAAAMHGYTAICASLLKAGAAVNAQTDPQKYAPLHSAAFAGHVETIELLLANGADRDLINYRDERAIDTARRQAQNPAVALLERH